jgi:hypothetical protein
MKALKKYFLTAFSWIASGGRPLWIASDAQRDAHDFMRFSFYKNHNLGIPAHIAGMFRFGLLRKS